MLRPSCALLGLVLASLGCGPSDDAEEEAFLPPVSETPARELVAGPVEEPPPGNVTLRGRLLDVEGNPLAAKHLVRLR